MLDYMLDAGSPTSGVIDPLLRSLAACGKCKSDSHACRNLHTLIHKTSKSLRVGVATVSTPVRISKRGKPFRATMVQYPLLKASAWARASFAEGGHFFLGGRSLQEASAFGETLHEFWKRYKLIEPQLSFFEEEDEANWKTCIPYAIHGDEGRGKAKKPIMVLSIQPLITSFDMTSSNLKGCFGSNTSRTCFSLYVKCYIEIVCTHLHKTVLMFLYTAEAHVVHEATVDRGSVCNVRWR